LVECVHPFDSYLLADVAEVAAYVVADHAEQVEDAVRFHEISFNEQAKTARKRVMFTLPRHPSTLPERWVRCQELKRVGDFAGRRRPRGAFPSPLPF